jgi:hypothetical protein
MLISPTLSFPIICMEGWNKLGLGNKAGFFSPTVTFPMICMEGRSQLRQGDKSVGPLPRLPALTCFGILYNSEKRLVWNWILFPRQLDCMFPALVMVVMYLNFATFPFALARCKIKSASSGTGHVGRGSESFKHICLIL